MSVLETILTLGFSGLFWLGKFLFFGGWTLARWMVWSMTPIWAVIAAIGALCGFVFGQ